FSHDPIIRLRRPPTPAPFPYTTLFRSKATFGGINYVGVRNLLGSGLELRKAGGDHLGNVALLVALGNGDGFVKLAVLEGAGNLRSEEHTSELQSLRHLVCRLLLEKKSN